MEGSVADSLLKRLSSALQPSVLENVAGQLGERKEAVSRGIELSTAALLGGLSRKSDDPDTMREVIDLAVKTPANAVASGVTAGQLTNPDSSYLASSKRFLSSLFGGSQDNGVNSIARESGLRPGTAWTVMALAAQSVLSSIGTRVRDEGMTTSSLAGLLRSEGPSLRTLAPAGVYNAFASPSFGVEARDPVITQSVESDPVVSQAVLKERSRLPWLLPLLALLALGTLWFGLRSRDRTYVAEAPVPSAPAVELRDVPATTGRLALGDFVTRTLPDGTTIAVPERGVEGRLLAFIQDPSRMPDKTTWFDFDRLLFDTGSATLQPQSQDQLRAVASILKANPGVHLKIGGYTDNVGSAAQNMTLSQDRANNVMSELVVLGVAPERLAAEGYGQQHSVADNSTEAGRAMNRRISMLVTQR